MQHARARTHDDHENRALSAQVVNRVEVDALANVGVPFFGVNLAVGLSVALPGFREDITRGLLGALPQVWACSLSILGHFGACSQHDDHKVEPASVVGVACRARPRWWASHLRGRV